MGDKRGFDLGCSHPVTRHVEHVVNAAGDPEIAILVTARAVTRKITPGEGGEIGFDEALVIAIDGAHLARPGMVDAQIAIGGTVERGILAVDKNRFDPEKGPGRRSGLGRGGAGKRCDQDAAGLGLPPGIDDRAAPFTDDVMVPHPGFGVYRLANASQKAKRGPVASGDWRVTLAHQRADGGWCGVEDADLVLLDNLPEAGTVRPCRHALEHQRCRPVRQRPVDNIAVAGHPADIGGAPVDVTILVVEHILMRHRGIDHVAAGGVKHTLRLAGRPRGIEDEHRVFGVHFRRRAIGRRLAHRLVIPDIAPVDPGNVTAGAAHDNHLVAVGAGGKRGIGVRLQRYRLATANTFICGDHHV